MSGNDIRNGQNRYAYLRVYSKALTEAEIKQQMAADQGNGNYALAKDNANVVMWLDYSKAANDEAEESYYDYYESIGREDMEGKYYAYGGCWGDTINDGDFCMNGLVGPDRSVQDELQEVKYVYQKYWFTADELDIRNHKISVYNESSHTDLSEYEVTYELLEDGMPLKGEGSSGTLTVSCAAGETKELTVPYKMPEKTKEDGEYFLNIKVSLKKATEWAKEGHVVAYEQFSVPAEVENIAEPKPEEEITEAEEDDILTLSNKDFELKINKSTGLIETYKYQNNTVMTAGPTPNYWRGAFDNDTHSNVYNAASAMWENANRGMTVKDIKCTPSADKTSYQIDVELGLDNSGNSIQKMQYIVYGTGEVKVTSDLDPVNANTELFRVGAEITLPKDYENIIWYGNGPMETLIDRKKGGEIRLWKDTVSNSFYPYPQPQASGNKTDVRFIAVESETSPVGILVVSSDVMEASALHFKTKDYKNVKTTYQLPTEEQRDYTILNVDYLSRGTGGATCGPDALDQYRLKADNYDYVYTYTIVPYLTADTDDAGLVKKSKSWRDVESFDEEGFNKKAAAKVDELIDRVSFLTSYRLKEDIVTARTQYERLNNDQKQFVTKLDLLEKAEAEIENFKDAKLYMKDQSDVGRDVDITDSVVIFKDESSPIGFSFEGGFAVPDDDGAVNAALSGDSKFTLEFWVNPDDLSVDNGFIMKGDNQVSVKTTNDGLEFYIHDGGWQLVVVPYGTAGFKMKQWNHVAATYDGAVMRLYVNGTQVGTNEIATTITNGQYALGIGQNYDPRYTGRKLRGRMASVHIYSSALTADQIMSRYKADKKEGKSTITADYYSVVLWYDADNYDVDLDTAKKGAEALAAEMDAYEVWSASQLEELEALKGRYDALPKDQQEIITARSYEKLLEKIALANALKNDDLEMVIPDQSKNGFTLPMQSTFQLEKDDTRGMVMSGYAAVPEAASEKLSGILTDGHAFTLETTVMYPTAKGMNMIFGNGDKGVAFRFMNNALYAYIYDGTNWNSLQPEIAVTAQKWYHTAVIYEDNTLSIYLDGKIVGSKEVGSIAASDYPFTIGYCPETKRDSNCLFENVRVYSKALTVKELNVGLEATDENVELWYDFGEAGLSEDSEVSATDLVLSDLEQTDLLKGETLQLTPDFKPYYANTNTEVVYSVDKEGIVSIAADGTVTAIGTGTVEITASLSSDPSKSEKVTLTVYKDRQDLLEQIENQQKELEEKEEELKNLEEQNSNKTDRLDALNKEIAALKKSLQDALAKLSSTENTGNTVTVGTIKYRVTNAQAKEVEVCDVTGKKLKTIEVPDTVKIGNTVYSVTGIADNAFAKMTKLKKITIGNNVTTIGKKAFFNDKKLKTIIVKSTKLKSVGKQALKNIHAKASISVPKANKAAYKKLFKGKGQKKTVKIK